MNEKETQFIEAYGKWVNTSFALINELVANLDPGLPSEKKAKIDRMFNDVCDEMEVLEKVGKELQTQVKFPVALAN